MPEFQYIACDPQGREVTGMLTAADRREASRRLTAQRLFPVRVEHEGRGDARRDSRRIGRRQVAAVYSQLAQLLQSGVALLRALELLEKQAARPALKRVLDDVRRRVSEGARLHEAMRQHPYAFSALAVSVIQAGEEGGFLEDAFARIAAFTQREEDLKGRVLAALAYPAFLLVVGVVIVATMLTFFVPKFAPIFDRLAQRGELPWATQALMDLSHALRSYGLLLAVTAAALGTAVARMAASAPGRRLVDRLRLGVPGFGPIARSLAVARFCRVLGTLMQNGVPLLRALEIAESAAGNRLLAEAIRSAAENVAAGKPLAEPLAAGGQFPEEIIEMISVGEEANKLESVLLGIADNTEHNAQRRLDLFVRLLEPVLLLAIAGLVLFVFSGLLLPVFRSSAALE
jgi:general secretion pathway protein F/type IV pilus assembly protein PilC